MKRDTFITACKFYVPSVSSFDDLRKTITGNNENIKFKPCMFFNGETIGKKGVLEIDKEHRFYPPKTEQKIMRLDVVAAVIAIQELVEEAKINKNNIEDIDLYIANGAFVENIF